VKKQLESGSPSLTPDDAALVAACRAGDPRALDEFFHRYVGRVERVLGRLAGATPDLEDMVQHTFLEAFSSFGRFMGEASLATWVTRIAVHVAYAQLRKGVRRQAALNVVLAGEGQATAPHGLENAFNDRQIAARLHVLLDRVKPKKRLAFLLYTVEGHSIEEVAALTGSSRAATKSRIWFARRELLQWVRQDPFFRELP
jgi:RNA polymerase sigma-70 factor (ECF subfamily)